MLPPTEGEEGPCFSDNKKLVDGEGGGSKVVHNYVTSFMDDPKRT